MNNRTIKSFWSTVLASAILSYLKFHGPSCPADSKAHSKKSLCDLGLSPREKTSNPPNLAILCSERVKYKVMFYLNFILSWEKKGFQMNWKKEEKPQSNLCTKSRGKVYKYQPERMRGFSDLFKDTWGWLFHFLHCSCHQLSVNCLIVLSCFLWKYLLILSMLNVTGHEHELQMKEYKEELMAESEQHQCFYK